MMDTHDRAVWTGILGNRLTLAVAQKMALNDDDASTIRT
jgi:hypothetical protein